MARVASTAPELKVEEVGEFEEVELLDVAEVLSSVDSLSRESRCRFTLPSRPDGAAFHASTVFSLSAICEVGSLDRR